MKPFTYIRAKAVQEAVKEAAENNNVKFIAGGTNLLDLMKENVTKPDKLVDINKLPLSKIEKTAKGGLLIGALATNTDVAYHETVQKNYPVLSQSILAGATPQLRNMATVGGNIMQRTRCFYFYDTAFTCNKREPGSQCSAIIGYNRIHAILGASDKCIAVHPSDMCVALAVLDATVIVEGTKGERRIPFGDFHRLQGDTPHIETNLKSDELIKAVELAPPTGANRSLYLKVRDRASYDFALVSVAVSYSWKGNVMTGTKIALGGVAHKPWRCLEAEKILNGKVMSEKRFQEAAEAALSAANPHQYNGFKVALAKKMIVRALKQTTGIA
jgi:xanthine dehydrogenase YagS FAD-binding subunit